MANKQSKSCFGGMKRKPDSTFNHRLKKLRISQGRDAEVEESEDGSDDEDVLSHENITSGDSTPLTTQSAAQSPRYPSMMKTIPCTYSGCNKTFNRQAKLQDHLRSHTNTRSFVCPQDGCDKDFLRKTHLDRHVKSAHSEVRNYHCTFNDCDKSFTTGTRLRRHEAAHEKRLEYKCNDCGQEFRKHATLQRHIAIEHEGNKPFVCEIALEDGSKCGAGFDKTNGLSNHQARMHGGAKYFCTICTVPIDDPGVSLMPEAMGFVTYAAFQEHNREIHPPTCITCGVACNTAKELNRHLELEHGMIQTINKPMHMCPEDGCVRSFTKKGNLEVHIKSVHGQQRPFICGGTELATLNHIEGWNGSGACGRDFKAKSQLEEHIRTLHLGLESRFKSKRKKPISESGPSSAVPDLHGGQSMVSLMTGTAYEDSLGRSISCLILGCQFMFHREYDLDVHLRARHGLDETQIQHIRARRGLSPEQKEEETSRFDDMMDDDDHFDTHENHENSFTEQLERAAANDEDFWLGGEQVAGRGEYEDEDDWETEEAEMQALIGDGHGWEDDIIVDPALR